MNALSVFFILAHLLAGASAAEAASSQDAPQLNGLPIELTLAILEDLQLIDLIRLAAASKAFAHLAALLILSSPQDPFAMNSFTGLPLVYPDQEKCMDHLERPQRTCVSLSTPMGMAAQVPALVPRPSGDFGVDRAWEDPRVILILNYLATANFQNAHLNAVFSKVATSLASDPKIGHHFAVIPALLKGPKETLQTAVGFLRTVLKESAKLDDLPDRSYRRLAPEVHALGCFIATLNGDSVMFKHIVMSCPSIFASPQHVLLALKTVVAHGSHDLLCFALETFKDLSHDDLTELILVAFAENDVVPLRYIREHQNFDMGTFIKFWIRLPEHVRVSIPFFNALFPLPSDTTSRWASFVNDRRNWD